MFDYKHIFQASRGQWVNVSNDSQHTDWGTQDTKLWVSQLRTIYKLSTNGQPYKNTSEVLAKHSQMPNSHRGTRTDVTRSRMSSLANQV